MDRYLIILILWLLALNAAYPALAQSGPDSAILSALKSKEAIVGVKAFTGGLKDPPKASLGIDPKTGKLLVAQNKRVVFKQTKGAGVVVDPAGLIVTNFHTLNQASHLSITLHDGTTLGGTIVKLWPKEDLSLIRITPPYQLKSISFADSSRLKLGDAVINIGHSQLLNNTLSGGTINGIANTRNSKEIGIIRVNMNLYEGDSGGPLLNLQGELIGMIVAKDRTRDKAAFAIPSNKIKKLYLDHIK